MKINNFEPMKAVYCYYFPEVRRLMHEVEMAIPDETFLVTSDADEIADKMSALFSPKLSIPKTNKGRIDLDEIHTPIIDRIVKAYECVIPALKYFKNTYPTSGSSEGIFHYLAQLRTRGIKHIYVLEGEYEGYEAQAKNLGLETRVIKESEMLSISDSHWLISNPSAREGNIIPNGKISLLAERGNKIFLDLAYAGSTDHYVFDAEHENIEAAVISFSKPYGVFRSRMGTFFSRNEVPSLYGNKWFKDILRSFQGLKIAEEIRPGGLCAKYKRLQKLIVDSLNQ